MENVKVILALLMTWSVQCTNSRVAFEQGPHLSRLLGLLSDEDNAIADPACVLVSWALDPESRGRPDLAQQLKDEATSSLVPIFAGPLLDAKDVVGEIHRLVKEYVHDTYSAIRFAAFWVLNRLLMVLTDDNSVKTLVISVRCLQVLLDYNPRFSDELERMGAVGILVACLKEEEVTWDGVDLNHAILCLVSSVLFDTREYREHVAADVSSVKKLLEVSNHWQPSEQLRAVMAIWELTYTDNQVWAALDATSTKACMQLAISLLRDMPEGVAVSSALDVLAELLSEASTLLGQALIEKEGPEQLVQHVKLEHVDRNSALLAVMTIAKNEHLVNVTAELEKHAGMKVAALFEEYPPCNLTDDADLREVYYAAFDRLPGWSSAEGTTEVPS